MKKKEILKILDEFVGGVAEIFFSTEFPEDNAYVAHVRRLIEAAQTTAMEASMKIADMKTRDFK